MDETMTCNTCDVPGRASTASEAIKARSNVREFGSETFTVWRCDNCRSIHALESVDLARYYRNYPVHNQKLDIFTRALLRSRLALMARFGLKKSHSILDYGCGKGLFVDYLKSKHFDAHGYDPYSDLYNQPISPAAKFDVVTSDQVIEHASDPAAMIQEWSNHVKPGGLLFISCPNGDAIDLRQPEKFIHELHQPYHRHLLSPQALVDLSRKAGFKHVQTISSSRNWTPFLNWSFLCAYMQKTGGFLDAVYEEPNYKLISSSPKLLAKGLMGGWIPCRTLMICAFIKES